MRLPFDSGDISIVAPGGEKDSYEKDATVDEVFENERVLSRTAVHFECAEPGGHELRPGHRLEFVIPEEFRSQLVRDVILQHRKDAKYCVNIGSDHYDPYGAYDRVELHDAVRGSWVEWQDPKGRKTDKFAEPRSAGNPEHENLHDWIATVGEVKSDAVRVTNVGEHEKYSVSNVHAIEVIFFPDLGNASFRERIYCPGTRFIDIDKKELLPAYGGGSHTEGIYAGAVALNQQHATPYELSDDPGEGVLKEGRDVRIALQPGPLIQVEVAIGDTEHLDHISPKTGRHTRLGYAKLWVGIKRKSSGEIDWFIQNANVPPQGIIAGGPKVEHEKINEGDELVIRSERDTAYLMGWRLAYDTESSETD